jgi:thiamine biosynthesis lipoprotein
MVPSALTGVTFHQEAMATRFSLTVSHQDPRYAQQAVAEAARELLGLEELLSRFVPHSDVARIRRARQGQLVLVAAETADCLCAAVEMERQTKGAFCIAYRHPARRPTAELLEISTTPPTVRPRDDHVELDLGAIGKGFALDRVAAVLLQWDVTQFLLRASHSTMLAGSAPPDQRGWPVHLGQTDPLPTLWLRQAAVSSSGTAIKGNHIVDPRGGAAAHQRVLAWAAAPRAAQADALSTALMVLTDQEIRQLCQQQPQYLVFTQRDEDDELVAWHQNNADVYR